MSRDSLAKKQIRDQYKQAIDGIEQADSSHACPAHGPLARGVCLMMQYHLLQMNEDIETVRITKGAIIKSMMAFVGSAMLCALVYYFKWS